MFAIVTGNSRGIGLAISESLRREGFVVPIIDRKDYDLMHSGIERLFRDYPECGVLVNNVGGMGRSKQEDWSDCMKKNYGIAFELTYFYLPKMIKKRFGRVITISSICSLDYSGLPWFNAAKSAQNVLNNSLARRYEGVTFNTICPDKVNVKPGENYKLNPDDISDVALSLIKSKIDGATIKVC